MQKFRLGASGLEVSTARSPTRIWWAKRSRRAATTFGFALRAQGARYPEELQQMVGR